MNVLRVIRIAACLAAGAFLSSPAFAEQYVETEPNDPCQNPQIIGMPPDWPSSVVGELSPRIDPEQPGDVDFYLFEAGEGMRLRAGLRGAAAPPLTLGDPFLGLFDADCNLIDFNDDYLDLSSRLEFDVPSGGVFILAASGCCDAGFNGDHFQEGTYRLRISVPPEPVPAITGRIVDAVSGEPLPGNAPPYSFVELVRCTPAGCVTGINSQVPDEFGVFRFEADFRDNQLDPGQYLVRAWAGDYQPAEIGPFDAVSGEVADLGDVGLQPPPFRFADIVACADIPAGGGRCRYTVDIRNNTAEDIQGLGWSIVSTFGGTSGLGFSIFQADHVQPVQLAALSGRTMRFSFDVPAGVAEGTVMCADGWFSDRATEFFGTLRGEPLFCITKQQGTFGVMKPKEAAALLGIDSVGSGRHGNGERVPLR